MMRTLSLPACLCLALLIAMAMVAETQPAEQLSLTDEIKATLKTLPLVRGAQVADSTFDQKVVVVTFFASWCQPCREEFAHLRELYKTYHRLGFEVIAVNYFEDFDNLSDDARLRKYLNLTKPPFSIVQGNDVISQQLGTITRIPTLFVFDRQGQRALRFENEPDGRQPTIDLDSLRQVIATLL